MSSKKLLFLYNPLAGLEVIKDGLHSIVDYFTKNGMLVTVYPTQHQNHAREIVEEIGGDYDYIVAAGGDGTLNEVVHGIITLKGKESLPDFGYIPTGSTNDFANSFGIPLDVQEAVKNVVEGKLAYLDVGKVNDRFFTYVTGFGLFTDVSYDTPQTLKNILGHVAYILEGAKRLGSVPKIPCKITVDNDEEIIGDFAMCIISNSTSVGGFKLPEAMSHDGDFLLIMLKYSDNFLDYNRAAGAVLGLRETGEEFVIRKFSNLRISTEEKVGWTVDGEFGGEYSFAEIEIYPKKLEIIVPK